MSDAFFGRDRTLSLHYGALPCAVGTAGVPSRKSLNPLSDKLARNSMFLISRVHLKTVILSQDVLHCGHSKISYSDFNLFETASFMCTAYL